MDNESSMNEQQPLTQGHLNATLADFKIDLRGEMSALRSELKGEMSALRSELKGEITTVAKAVIELTGEMDLRFRQLVNLVSRTRSDVLAACENAVFKAEKIDRDQTFTRYRLDGLEQRVSALERRRRKPS